MNNEISSDVPYLINQLNLMKNKNNSNQIIKISYENVIIDGTNQLTKEQTKNVAQIQIGNISNEKKYLTLVMIDPDAPSSSEAITGPFLHWILSNFQGKNSNEGQTICEYMGPGPRPGTGEHRYIYLLYQSNEVIKKEKEFSDIPSRRKFPLEKFVLENELQLIDLTYFTVQA